MCQEAKPIRSVVLFEGQVKWIMERDTPEERLAAWEAITSIAFPDDEKNPFRPPSIPTDGSRLTPSDRVKRDVYNLFKDIIESRAVKNNGKVKDIKKVEAGRLGAEARIAKRAESEAENNPLPIENPKIAEEIRVPKKRGLSETVQDRRVRSGASESVMEGSCKPNIPIGFRKNNNLSATDIERIAQWNAAIPDAAALKAYLKKNYMYQNKSLVCSDAFCEFAYQKLAKVDGWRSTRDGSALNDIRTAIHWMSIDYTKKNGEIRRVEEEERQKDADADFKRMSAEADRINPSELADKERKRRRKAEKEALQKIMRGEL